MFFSIQVIAIIVAVTVDHKLAVYVPLVVPSIYLVMMAPGTFGGGSDISLIKLHELLEPNWVHAEELSAYIKKYWVALQYVMSATARQGNCTSLGLLSIGTAIYYFFGLNNVILAVILGTVGVVLYIMATRVNRPLSIFKDPKFRSTMDERFINEFRLAVTSLVAFFDLFPEDQNYKFVADAVLEDEYARQFINTWRK
ncbi:MAG: hypothetical protein DSY85_07155 [Marinomonas sp.]|nr:MAG: hypothetical protein DSY85_07155 [Marinomonas sp.]